jgi:hypothetical protein
METTEKDGPGRPEFMPSEIDKAWVFRAAAVGIPQELIASRIENPHTEKPITVKTLRKHFRMVLDQGLADVAIKVMTTAYEVAIDKNHEKFAQMNIWTQKTRLGMKEVTVSEMTGANGEPLTVPGLVIIKGSHDSQTGAE